MNAGKTTISNFKRGLDGLQISSLGRLYLAETEIDALVTLYKDPNDPDRVCWRTFEDDIDKGIFGTERSIYLFFPFSLSDRDLFKLYILRTVRIYSVYRERN